MSHSFSWNCTNAISKQLQHCVYIFAAHCSTILILFTKDELNKHIALSTTYHTCNHLFICINHSLLTMQFFTISHVFLMQNTLNLLNTPFSHFLHYIKGYIIPVYSLLHKNNDNNNNNSIAVKISLLNILTHGCRIFCNSFRKWIIAMKTLI